MVSSSSQICMGYIIGRFLGLVIGVVTDPNDEAKKFAPQNLEPRISLVNPKLRKPVHLNRQRRSTTRPGSVFATCSSNKLT